ncbi:hypothetical protein [Paenarthrobacter sp. NPDC091669]|uniref:hypothetical protein n=1 Tax=Paenarthrobacter sp. NPDC091669 TaxID=3364384 RepID=UPI003800FFB1
MSDNRPHIRARKYAWKDKAGNETPGISLWGRNLAAHLTYDEARRLADKLHDLVDANNPTTESE